MEKLAIKDTIELIDGLLTSLEVIAGAAKDGKIGVEDLPLLLKLVPVVGPAVDGVGNIPAELADLSAEEGAELISHVMAKLAIESEKARSVIEKALKALIAIQQLVQAVKA
jgi:hypothetical protein